LRNVPSTTALRAFEAASRYLNFQRAAEELNVTPGAVSRQIQSLEALLGGALFLRHHKRVELTPLGRRYADEIRAPLQQLSEATSRIKGESQSQAISVCAYPSFAIRWFIPRWGRFYDSHPQIDLRLTTTLNPADFDSGAYHMAIQVLPDGGPRPGLRARKLLEIDTFPVCSPDVARAIKTPADLTRMTLLHGHPRPRDWARWCEAAGVSGLDTTRGLRFESLNLAFQAAIEGLGVAIGVEALVEEDLKHGRLVRLFDTARRSNHPFYLVYPDASTDDPNVAALSDWLIEEGRGD
jgi:LysR family transcriptional regulator, glycine cleavage system transcriptional activator